MRILLFRAGSLWGVPLQVDITWGVGALICAGAIWTVFPKYLWLGFASVIILYGSLLAHELAHVYVGRKIGLSAKEILLSVTGAQAVFTGDENRNEALLAIAGPIMSIVLAVVFGVFATLTIAARHGTDLMQDPLSAGLALGVIVNVVNAGFNLLPIYPLDGGRILHAGLLRLTRNHLQAISISCAITLTICFAVIGWTEWSIFHRHDGNGGFMRLILAVMLGGQALGAYRTEAKKAKKTVDSPNNTKN